MTRYVLLLVFISAFLFVFTGCEQADLTSPEVSLNTEPTDPVGEEPVCKDFRELKLIAGQNTEIGIVFLVRDGDKLEVSYRLTNLEWRLGETHVFAGLCEDMPLNKKGGPKVGKFPYKEPDYTSDAKVRYFDLPVPYNCICVAAHAEVSKVTKVWDPDLNMYVKIWQEETAWAYDKDSMPFETGWGWFLPLCCE